MRFGLVISMASCVSKANSRTQKAPCLKKAGSLDGISRRTYRTGEPHRITGFVPIGLVTTGRAARSGAARMAGGTSRHGNLASDGLRNHPANLDRHFFLDG